MGLSAPLPGALAPSSSSPTYDEQLGITFTQNQNALAYNVTALAQTDADGYGPAYILNGLTPLGYWYQVGISYHWPGATGGYEPSFAFSYQVFGPNGSPVYPQNGGAGLGSFSKAVGSGDSVLLSLTFSGTSVEMVAQDWNTGATAKESYGNQGSSSFVGNPSSPSSSTGFFTGLMTEWYHVLPYSGNEGKVTYTNAASALSSAWLWIDEFNPSSSGAPLFINQTRSPVTFANPQQLYPFSSNGATMYGSAHQFITGQLNGASSRVALSPAAPEAASPTFSASYTIGGLQQSSDIPAGTSTIVEADPGTSITLSLNSSDSSALESWVFAGTGNFAITSVTFEAGSNVTYVYYDVVQETVAYQVAGGGKPIPVASTPELVYQEPPPSPSAAPSAVAVKQLIGTSPVVVFALLGSEASLNGTLMGATGDRWATSAQDWSVSAPNAIPDPIQFYEQYQVTLDYSVDGGGTPPQAPEFTSTSFGSPVSTPVSVNPTAGWVDAASGYAFTNIINGSAQGERWIDTGGNGIGFPNQSYRGIGSISSPNESITEDYAHEYYADLSVNDASGGVVSNIVSQGGKGALAQAGGGWFVAGSNLNASVGANTGWQFESWEGSGAGAYNGTSASIQITLTGPVNESAIFYTQLAISASAGTNIAYSYGTEAGTVLAGTAKTLYLSPSTNVTLRSTPSLFVYSFGSWQGAGLVNATKPSVALVVESPSAVTGTSSYDYPVVLGAVVTAVVIVLAGSLLVLNRQRRTTALASPPT